MPSGTAAQGTLAASGAGRTATSTAGTVSRGLSAGKTSANTAARTAPSQSNALNTFDKAGDSLE